MSDSSFDRQSIAAIYALHLPGGQSPEDLQDDVFVSEVGPYFTPELFGQKEDPEVLEARARQPETMADYLLASDQITDSTHAKICFALGQLGQQETLMNIGHNLSPDVVELRRFLGLKQRYNL